MAWLWRPLFGLSVRVNPVQSRGGQNIHSASHGCSNVSSNLQLGGKKATVLASIVPIAIIISAREMNLKRSPK